MRIPALLLLSLLPGLGQAQKISYTVRFPNAAHHEAQITMLVSGAPAGKLQCRMSRSSPGRYATHEFGKNVYDVTATNGAGKALPLTQTEGDVYGVSGAGGTVQVRYTLYGHYADGTYASIDPESMHLNMPAAFMWVKGLEEAPIQISFELPDTTLSIATQLVPGADRRTFTAPDLQYFMDSPVKIGKLQWRSWTVPQDDKDLQFRLAAEADTSAAGIDWLTGKVKALTEQARAVFGEYPSYDHGTYTFLASLNPWVHGDGMEHRNCTMISIPFFPGDHSLSVFAHEYFHSWNVERLRPRSLEPFNFEHANMSEALWFAEGFTTYYGVLLTVRTGLETPETYAGVLGRLVNAKLNTPGGKYHSPLESSRMAVFTDAGVSIDQTNYATRFLSYYPHGAALALALDLMLRNRYHSSLDRMMQALWRSNGKPETPYTMADLQAGLAKASDPAFAEEFFRRYIYGHEAPDYAALLANAGYALQKADPGRAWIGDPEWTGTGEGLLLESNTVRDSPLYEAGLDIGDALVSLDNRAVSDETALRKIVAAHKPGERLTVVYQHRGRILHTVLTLAADPSLTVVLYEKAGLPVTAPIKAFRQAWLGPQ